jgi:hypothetical protein
MKRFVRLRRKRDELGVVAIIAALLSVVLLMFAAYAVDIGMQINRKHQLHDTLDAAAQAGAYNLPGNSNTAKADALAFALAHDPTETGSLKPNVDFWCVVASKLTSGVYQPDSTQLPSTCYPGASPYTAGAAYKTTGRTVSCSSKLCAIPCVEPAQNTATPKIACNTIRVYQGRTVDFGFAPAGGIQHGSTGNIISVACKGSCGTIAPNPMDVAVVADRTMSMNTTDVSAMITGIKGMLQQMTPSQQFVSLGTIGRSGASSTSQSGSCVSGQLSYPSSSVDTGSFVPVSFSKDYVDGAGTLQTGTALIKAIECLSNRSPVETGTALAAPMKAAARYLLGYDANNVGELDVPPRTPTPRKVLIFETDGQPNERIAYTAANQINRKIGSTSLTSTAEPFSSQMSLDPTPVNTTQADTTVTTGTTTNKTKTITHNKTITYTYNGGAGACQNLANVATEAKAQGILVIMIAYNLTGKKCFDWDGHAPCAAGDSNCKGSVAGYDDRSNNYLAGTSTVAGPEAQTVVTSGGVTTTTKYETKTETRHNKAASSTSVLSVMAAAASPTSVVDGSGGVPSAAESDCSTTAMQTAENGDGDFFFCAASGTTMAPIFRTALSQAAKGIKLLKAW